MSSSLSCSQNSLYQHTIHSQTLIQVPSSYLLCSRAKLQISLSIACDDEDEMLVWVVCDPPSAASVWLCRCSIALSLKFAKPKLRWSIGPASCVEVECLSDAAIPRRIDEVSFSWRIRIRISRVGISGVCVRYSTLDCCIVLYCRCNSGLYLTWCFICFLFGSLIQIRFDILRRFLCLWEMKKTAQQRVFVFKLIL